ncbi:MAG: hypothetical protein J5678_06660 [Bacteroidaceae bacterium]|nr:hypothetical protein [Bacteroidaceae bacterium]
MNLRTYVSTAVWLLPVSMAAAVALWALKMPLSWTAVAGLLTALVCTIALRLASNELQLIRVRSWAVSALFVLLMAVCTPIHQWSPTSMAICVLYLTHIISLLFSTHTRSPQLCIFISSCGLAGMSMIFPPCIVLLVPMLLAMVVFLRSISGRALAALIFGLLLPLEVWVAWHLVTTGMLPDLSMPNVQLSFFNSSTFEFFNSQLIIPFFLLFFSLLSLIHYLRTSLNDRTETRMHYFSVIAEWPVLVGLLLVGQQATGGIATTLIVCGSILIAHWMVFARGWIADVLFFIFLAVCIYLALPLS